tara:strand:- start:4658 stop:5740 length:1083 start_codon:yes stop_codon:yes gene_type:complete
MAISTEVLNTTFEDLRGPLVNSFVRSNELFEALSDKARMPMEGGSLIERTFTGGAPARGVGVYVGDELLNMTRRQQIKKFQVEPHRLVVAINIPKRELLMNSGKLAIIRLIEEYPQTVMEGVKADINKFMLTGVSRGLVFQSSELRGLLHLNGQLGTGIGTGVTNGLIDFVAPTSQSDTVQGVDKSSSYFHFNQYNAATAWATDGMKTLRRTYRECAHYAGGVGKGPDLVIMDDGTYGNFEDTRRSNIRVSVVQDPDDKKGSNMLGLELGVAKVFSSLDLATGDFTATGGTVADPTEGVSYFLNTDFLEFPMHEAPKIGKFEERVGDQDVVTAIFSMQGNLICTKLPAQGAVCGTFGTVA